MERMFHKLWYRAALSYASRETHDRERRICFCASGFLWREERSLSFAFRPFLFFLSFLFHLFSFFSKVKSAELYGGLLGTWRNSSPKNAIWGLRTKG